MISVFSATKRVPVNKGVTWNGQIDWRTEQPCRTDHHFTPCAPCVCTCMHCSRSRGCLCQCVHLSRGARTCVPWRPDLRIPLWFTRVGGNEWSIARPVSPLYTRVRQAEGQSAWPFPVLRVARIMQKSWCLGAVPAQASCREE